MPTMAQLEQQLDRNKTRIARLMVKNATTSPARGAMKQVQELMPKRVTSGAASARPAQHFPGLPAPLRHPAPSPVRASAAPGSLTTPAAPEDNLVKAKGIVFDANDATAIGMAFIALSKLRLTPEDRSAIAKQLRQKNASLATAVR